MVIHELTLSFHVDEMSKKVSLLKKTRKTAFKMLLPIVIF